MPEFVVFYTIGENGAFLRGGGYDPREYGGTLKLAEAARFPTKKMAREVAQAYMLMCRAQPISRGDCFSILREE